MKATGIVRRIDDLGRVVIPKEIRRTMRIREGDPLEIYTTKDGEVIFKKYSLLGGLEDFAAQFCDTLSHSTEFTAAVTDRDAIIAVAGVGKRELLGKTISEPLERIMEDRQGWVGGRSGGEGGGGGGPGGFYGGGSRAHSMRGRRAGSGAVPHQRRPRRRRDGVQAGPDGSGIFGKEHGKLKREPYRMAIRFSFDEK